MSEETIYHIASGQYATLEEAQQALQKIATMCEIAVNTMQDIRDSIKYLERHIR